MTTIRVTRENRDALAHLAESEYRCTTLDEALRALLFEHESRAAMARLAADPEALREYQEEARQLAEVDVEIRE